MENILITGGCGFIGFNIIANLMKGYNIQIIDNFNEFYDPQIKRQNWEMLRQFHLQMKCTSTLELIEENILNLNEISSELRQNIQYIIHLAAQPGVRESFEDEEKYFQQNLEGTRSVLKFAANINLEKIINFSSSSIYGNQRNYPLTENMLPQPISPYGQSKYEAEKLCSEFSESVSYPLFTLRPFSVYGPQQRPRLAIRDFIDQILQDQPITINGDGEKKRDYTYVSDIVQAVKLCLQTDVEQGHYIFNVGNGNPISINELISKISVLLDKYPEINYKDDAKGDVDQTWASLDKIHQYLNFQPKIQIEEGLKKYFQWLQNPELSQLLLELP